MSNFLLKRLFLIFIFINSFFGNINLFANKENINNNDIIKVGVEHLPPLSFTNTGKDFDGLSAHILKVISQKSSFKYEYIIASKEELLVSFKKGEIDILPSSFFSKDLQKYGKFSKPYFKTKNSFYIKKIRLDIDSFESLEDKKLAIRANYINLDKIKTKYPKIDLIKTKSLEETIEKVIFEQADALYESKTIVDYILKKNNIHTLYEVPQDSFKEKTVHFLVKKDKTKLLETLNEGLSALTNEQLLKIQNRWLNKDSKDENNTLTKPYKSIVLLDVLPIKEIVLGSLVLIVIFYFIWKFITKGSEKEFALKNSIYIVIVAFLFFSTTITLLSLKNIENSQKNGIEHALINLLDNTYKSITIWEENIFYRMDAFIKSENELLKKVFIEQKGFNDLNNSFIKYSNFLRNTKFYLISKDFEILNNDIYEDKRLIINKSFEKIALDRIDEDRWAIPPHRHDIYIEKDFVFVNKVYTKDRTFLGYLLVFIDPKNNFFNILSSAVLGITGETYAVNKNGLMVSKSNFEHELRKKDILKNKKSSFLNIIVSSKLLNMSFENKKGVTTIPYKNYYGQNVFGVWLVSEKLNTTFIMEITQKEGMKSIVRLKKTIMIVFVSIILFTLFLTLFIVWISNKSRKILLERNKELNKLLNSFDSNVIFSKTDLKGNIVHVSQAFCEISGYKKEELIGKSHNVVRHPDMPSETFKQIWKTIKSQACIKVEIKNLRKDGSYYWVESKFEPDYDNDGKHIGYTAVRQDITNKKELESLSETLEQKVKDRTKELEESEQRFVNLFDLAPDSVFIAKGNKIISCNYKTVELFGFESRDEVLNSTILDLSAENQDENIPTKSLVKQRIDETLHRGYHNFEWLHKRKNGEVFKADVILSTIVLEGELHLYAVVRDITQKKLLENKLKEFNRKTKDSIEYASLIQEALIPPKELFDSYFSDHFAIWEQKDIVGGDIYLFNGLRNKDECLLFVIDCTGHGVPGAFVTMLVKAIERQISSLILNKEEMEVSPAYILKYFNRTMKYLLKQDNEDSISNAGFDAGVLYYNKKERIIKYAGAEIPLFYVYNGKAGILKGNRHSIGYKKSKIDYEFTDHLINVENDMRFYITTDGFIDQNGGQKGFPFSKRRFKELLETHYEKSFAKQKEIFLEELKQYQKDEERNDDITVIGIKISEESFVSNDKTETIEWFI